MNKDVLIDLQRRLELSGAIAREISKEVGNINEMLHDENKKALPNRVDETKSQVKTDIANLIKELNNINASIK